MVGKPMECVSKKAHGAWMAHLNPCQEDRMFTTKYKCHSPTLESIMAINQIITKAYQVTKFNQRTSDSGNGNRSVS